MGKRELPEILLIPSPHKEKERVRSVVERHNEERERVRSVVERHNEERERVRSLVYPTPLYLSTHRGEDYTFTSVVLLLLIYIRGGFDES